MRFRLPARCFNDKDHGIKPPKTAAAPDHCSAFVATGSYTKDNNAVIAHNSWSSYMDGERRTYVFDVTPSQGRRFMMDAGIAITEKGNYGGYANNWLVVDNKTKPRPPGWLCHGGQVSRKSETQRAHALGTGRVRMKRRARCRTRWRMRQ